MFVEQAQFVLQYKKSNLTCLILAEIEILNSVISGATGRRSNVEITLVLLLQIESLLCRTSLK